MSIEDSIRLHLSAIRERVMSLRQEIIDAHIMISRTQYANLNGDVTLLDKGKATITTSVADIQHLLRHGGSACIKTNRLEHYDSTMAELANYIRDLVDHAIVSHVTLHVFESNHGTESFPMHTDPADVVLCMLDGSKTLDVDDGISPVSVLVTMDAPLYIPMHIPHKATNDEDNIMLSIGIERYTAEHIRNEG